MYLLWLTDLISYDFLPCLPAALASLQFLEYTRYIHSLGFHSVPEIFNSLSTFSASSLPACESPLKSHLVNGAPPGQPVIKANRFSHSQTPFSITGFFLFPYHLLTFNILYDYLLCILFIICLFHG